MVVCALTGVPLVHSGCRRMSGISLRGIFSHAHAVSDVISFSLSLSLTENPNTVWYTITNRNPSLVPRLISSFGYEKEPGYEATEILWNMPHKQPVPFTPFSNITLYSLVLFLVGKSALVSSFNLRSRKSLKMGSGFSPSNCLVNSTSAIYCMHEQSMKHVPSKKEKGGAGYAKVPGCFVGQCRLHCLAFFQRLM